MTVHNLHVRGNPDAANFVARLAEIIVKLGFNVTFSRSPSQPPKGAARHAPNRSRSNMQMALPTPHGPLFQLSTRFICTSRVFSAVPR